MHEFIRTEMLLGGVAMARLAQAHVAVFGVGGVGGAAAEALARSGVGEISLFDHDVVSLSNINRQTIALHSTVGQRKVDVMRTRILDINPKAVVHTQAVFYTPENAADYPLAAYHYIIDAIDTVSAKIALITGAQAVGTPIISAMGAGNRLDPAALLVGDLFATSGCPLARVMRKELRARGIFALRVVFSREEAKTPLFQPDDATGKRQTPGSVAFVPPVAGLMLAGEVVRALAGEGDDA